MIVRRLASKRLLIPLASLAAVLLAPFTGVGWYYSGEIESGGLRIDHSERELTMEVVTKGEGVITLRRVGGSARLDEPGTIGLLGERGYGRIGPVLEISGDTVTREYRPFDGAIEPGDPVRMERKAIPGDPRRGLGLDYEDVTISGEVGPLPAWFIDGESGTWAILVHGRRSDRREMLRILGPVADSGVPALVISYRNDREAALDPSGYYGFGQTEWEDLEAAVEYALAHGANDVILVGHSMGGAICAAFLKASPLASRVAAAIFDAPMLDFGETVNLAARRRNVPQPIATFAKWLSGHRHGVDWRALDYTDGVIRRDMPILLFHGTEDPTVPVGISDRLAKARPDTVTYIRTPGGQHVGSWNIDPAAYETAVRDFLAAHAR